MDEVVTSETLLKGSLTQIIFLDIVINRGN